ncbi:MAG TPA: hypothetical protein VEK11_12475 [Thermoanaerobaculia bacterium]|nr:hypothetical protein [Thermoanaerobaculia bacterium]
MWTQRIVVTIVVISSGACFWLAGTRFLNLRTMESPKRQQRAGASWTAWPACTRTSFPAADAAQLPF